MPDRTDPAWDEYLSTGEDPTSGELKEADDEVISDEIVPGQWQQYARPKKERVMTEEQRQSNYSRIRRNQEIRKWELENPKKAMTFAIIENVLAIVGFALIVWFCFSYSSPYVRISESKSYFSRYRGPSVDSNGYRSMKTATFYENIVTFDKIITLKVVFKP